MEVMLDEHRASIELRSARRARAQLLRHRRTRCDALRTARRRQHHRRRLTDELLDLERLSRAPRSDRRVQRDESGAQARPRVLAGQVRHIVQRAVSESGRRARACLQGRLGARQSWRHRDGPGLNTKVAQVVAGEFGLPLSRVQKKSVSATDTSKIANTSATAGLPAGDLNGKAAEAAARTIRARLAELAAKQLGGHAGRRAVRDAARCRSTAARCVFEQLVGAAYLARVQLWSDGFYATPKVHWDAKTLTGHPFYYFAYGAAVIEVGDRYIDRRMETAARRRAARRRSIDQSGDRSRPDRRRLHSRAWAGSPPRNSGGIATAA